MASKQPLDPDLLAEQEAAAALAAADVVAAAAAAQAAQAANGNPPCNITERAVAAAASLNPFAARRIVEGSKGAQYIAARKVFGDTCYAEHIDAYLDACFNRIPESLVR